MRVQSLGRKDPLEKRMATHSSILVWEILQTEEFTRLQSIGSHRVRLDHRSLTFFGSWALESEEGYALSAQQKACVYIT